MSSNRDLLRQIGRLAAIRRGADEALARADREASKLRHRLRFIVSRRKRAYDYEVLVARLDPDGYIYFSQDNERCGDPLIWGDWKNHYYREGASGQLSIDEARALAKWLLKITAGLPNHKVPLRGEADE